MRGRGDPGSSQRLAEGRLGEALLARQRQLAHIHDQFDAPACLRRSMNASIVKPS